MRRHRIMPCITGIRPFSSGAASAARWTSVSRSGWPGALRPTRPTEPSALTFSTQSRTIGCIMPQIAAASVRVTPP
jgi:hypothetical protein